MLLVNQILHNRYRVMRQLGHGGMGAVYEAHDSVFDTTCALKEITIDLSKSANPKQQEMLLLAFEREAKLLAKIKHEAVPHVRDYFTEDNRQYLVMELIEGKDLGEMLEERKSPFPIDDVVRWTEQLLDGLDYLHTQNPPIFHRDLKPQNLKLTPRGKIKLLDFGIAKGGQEVPNAQTVNNQTFVAATLNYSPIEQIFRVLDPVFREVLIQRYEERVKLIMMQNADARSDLYALGATVYHLLTGVLPIDALKRTIEVWSGKRDPLEHPTSLNNRIPPEVSLVLLRSMELDHGRRYSTALEMQHALQQAVAAGRAREANQAQNTLEMGDAPSTWADSNAPETRLGVAPVLPTDATQQIPADKLPSFVKPGTSEETIQAGGVGFTPNQAGGPPPPTPNTPFGSGGVAAPTEFANISSVSTGGEMQQPPPGFSTGGQSQGGYSDPSFAPGVVGPAEKKKSNKLIWILPVLLLFFIGVAVAGGGAIYWYSLMGDPTPTPTPAASPSATTSPSPSASSSPSASPSSSASPSPSPTTSPGASDPRPTVQPTSKPVIQPDPTKAPPKKTPPAKTPKKNSDCIFTGDC